MEKLGSFKPKFKVRSLVPSLYIKYSLVGILLVTGVIEMAPGTGNNGFESRRYLIYNNCYG